MDSARATTAGGFTLVELMVGAATLAIAITALLGAFLGQVTLNEHARNLTLAINDANRVMEQLRLLNNVPACGGTPNGDPDPVFGTNPAGCVGQCTNWNQWLAEAGGGKSISLDPDTNELIVVTCTSDQGGLNWCGETGGANDQVGADEWRTVVGGPGTQHDPIRLTVAVCWRHRNRTLGECSWIAGQLQPGDGAVPPNDGINGFTLNNVIESPAMLTTLMTCRS